MRKKCARASCPTPSPALQMRNLNSFLFFSSKRDLSMCTWTNESWKCEKVCFFGQYFDYHSDQENLIVNYTKNLLSWVREKKSESFSWKPIQCVVKILPKLSPEKKWQKMKFQDTKTMEWFAWTFDYELLCKKGIFLWLENWWKSKTNNNWESKTKITKNRKSKIFRQI